MPEGQIGFQVGELTSHLPQSQKAKTKQKQYCNKFNKDIFKMCTSKKKKNLKKKK